MVFGVVIEYPSQSQTDRKINGKTAKQRPFKLFDRLKGRKYILKNMKLANKPKPGVPPTQQPVNH
jgi:hypothetical protein